MEHRSAIVAGIRSRRSRQALHVGRLAVGALFVLGGALVNALYLVTGTDYAGFADSSYLAVVRDTWAPVVPHQEIWIGLLVAFEALAGGLVWSGGHRATVGVIAIMAFHVLLLPFGWFLYVWSVPMLLRLGQLLGAHQRELQTHPELRRGPKVPPSTAASCRPSPRLWPLTGRDTSEVLTSSNDMPRRVTT